MRADTQTVSVQVAPEQLFDFVVDPRNLPRWAIHFCQSVRPNADGSWTARGEEGEVTFRVRADGKCGVVDWHLTPAPGVEVLAASRVLPSGSGATYVFTQFRAPGMPDEGFQKQISDLREELQALRAALEPIGERSGTV